MEPLPHTADVLVVGAGAAGMFAALCAAREGGRVVLVSGRPLPQTASYYAQGGLAAALGRDDSIELHAQDTMSAGRGLVVTAAAMTVCREAPECLGRLDELGMRFDAKPNGTLALSLEGGHSARRVVHAGGSATGQHVVTHLVACVARESRIVVVEDRRVIALFMDDGECAGAVLDDYASIDARAVILATGGTAAMWARTTNPRGSYGSGIQLARSAGADLADLEFMQFHPTAVADVAGLDGFLVTEAVRGEGATLHDLSGERFVDELLPRDAVSRAVHERLVATGDPHVLLDMRDMDLERFPSVVRALRLAGLDPARERIPVAPAAHYSMGGIVTDLDGRSTVAGLYAAGECACSGLHGANRLASNSLTECFVFGRRAARSALDRSTARRPQPRRLSRTSVVDGPPMMSTRERLSRHGGLQRDRDGLQLVRADRYPLAQLFAASALARRETRGGHFRRDYPSSDRALDRHHTLLRGDRTTAQLVLDREIWGPAVVEVRERGEAAAPSPEPFEAVGRADRGGELSARSDLELAVRVRQVHLDGS